MQKRSVAAGRRPSGTDGSDFSYRMVVDSRYTKVAQGKSRLGALLVAQDQVSGKIIAKGPKVGRLFPLLPSPPPVSNSIACNLAQCDNQTASQIIWTVLVFLSALPEKKIETLSAVSLSLGFISLVIGELGRRRSSKRLLRLYNIFSSVATALSVVCIFRSNLYLKIFAVGTSITLVHNMSPKAVS